MRFPGGRHAKRIVLETAGWVADGAVAVVERAVTSPELAWPGRWSSWRTRRYGDTRLEFGEFA